MLANWFNFIVLHNHNMYICQKKFRCIHINNECIIRIHVAGKIFLGN